MPGKEQILRTSGFILAIVLTALNLQAQQVGDPDFDPIPQSPVYEKGTGPALFIDEAHNNFHTLNGRYKSFAKLLQKDGYNLKVFAEEFSETGLENAKILVIANALHESNIEDWILPNPSAFTKDEIAAVVDWVKEGGSLFLIADHMPCPGAAADLAAAFGFEFNNGFAFDTTRQANDFFTRENKTLKSNSITNGRNEAEKIDSVVSFTGQAFKIPEAAEPLLVLNSNFISSMPDTAWVFREDTPRIPVGGWSQGAFMKFGKGRLAVFGEAAMIHSPGFWKKQKKNGHESSGGKTERTVSVECHSLVGWFD